MHCFQQSERYELMSQNNTWCFAWHVVWTISFKKGCLAEFMLITVCISSAIFCLLKGFFSLFTWYLTFWTYFESRGWCSDSKLSVKICLTDFPASISDLTCDLVSGDVLIYSWFVSLALPCLLTTSIGFFYVSMYSAIALFIVSNEWPGILSNQLILFL